MLLILKYIKKSSTFVKKVKWKRITFNWVIMYYCICTVSTSNKNRLTCIPVFLILPVLWRCPFSLRGSISLASIELSVCHGKALRVEVDVPSRKEDRVCQRQWTFKWQEDMRVSPSTARQSSPPWWYTGTQSTWQTGSCQSLWCHCWAHANHPYI